MANTLPKATKAILAAPPQARVGGVRSVFMYRDDEGNPAAVYFEDSPHDAYTQHTVFITPIEDLAERVAAENKNLASMGVAPLAEADVEAMREVIEKAHTPDVIAAYQARVDEEIRKQDGIEL